MSVRDSIEWTLFDSDLTTVLGILPAKSSMLYVQLNEPGSGELKIPLESVAAGVISSGMFAEAKYRGAVRGGFFIENINKVHVDSSEGGGQLLSLSGRGSLALLDDAIVWDDGTSATTRNFNGSKASILITLIEEAKARGALLNLDYDFTAGLDSNGVGWSDSESLSFNVGKSVLDVTRELAKLGMDFDIVPDGLGSFVLSAYKNGKGSDKSDSIYFRVGVNCTEVSSLEAGGEIRNVLRVQYPAGYTIVSDPTSISTRRRREGLVDAGYAGDSEVALTFGQAELEDSKDPRVSIGVNIYDGSGPRAFMDYELGDSIMLDKKGVETIYRLRGMQLAWAEGKYADVVVDLNSTILENEIRMGQDIRRLKEIWATAHDAGLTTSTFWAAIGGNDNNGEVRCMQVVANKIYVGGEFTRIGGIEANRIAVYDIPTGLWSTLGTGLNAACLALAVNFPNVYVGGVFTTAGGVAVSYVARWTGAAWQAMGVGVPTTCSSIAVTGTTVYAGFSGPTDFIRKWNGSAWSALGTGLNNTPLAIVCDAFNVWAGGSFTTAGGVAVNYFARWNGSAWSAFGSGLNDWVLTILKDGADFFVGGKFTTAGGNPANHIAFWDNTLSAWEDVGGGTDGDVWALATNGFDIYAAGLFDDAGGVAVESVAKWNRGSWSALGSGVVGTCWSVAVHSVNVYVGGGFTIGSDPTTRYIAAYLTTFEAIVDYLESSQIFNLAEAIHGATAKATPVDADEWGIWDSVSKLLRKVTWANIKATLKTYFDTIYESLTNKSTDINADQASNTKYPSVKAVYDWATGLFTNAWVIARTLTGFTAGAGTVTATDTILQAIQKLAGNALNYVSIDLVQSQLLIDQITSGTNTAYTITTSGHLLTLKIPEKWVIQMHATNGVAPTLNRDGLGAKPLKYYDATGTITAVLASSMLINNWYEVMYDGANYIVLDFPVGGSSSAPATTAANDFQVGDGAGAWIKKTLAETVTILRTGGTTIDVFYPGGQNAQVPGSTTQYLNPYALGLFALAGRAMVLTRPCIIKNLTTLLNAAQPAGGNLVSTVVDGGGTSLGITTTYTPGQSGVKQDLVNTYTVTQAMVTAGMAITIRLANGSGSASGNIGGYGLELEYT